jgi:hypothetical protein
MNVLTLKDWPTLRQWIQVVAAALVALLVSYSVIDNASADQILLLLAAVLPPALSIFNSADGKRTFVYGTILAVQAFVIAMNWADALHVNPVVNLLLAALGAGVAVTHTSTPLAAVKRSTL